MSFQVLQRQKLCGPDPEGSEAHSPMNILISLFMPGPPDFVRLSGSSKTSSISSSVTSLQIAASPTAFNKINLMEPCSIFLSCLVSRTISSHLSSAGSSGKSKYPEYTHNIVVFFSGNIISLSGHGRRQDTSDPHTFSMGQPEVHQFLNGMSEGMTEIQQGTDSCSFGSSSTTALLIRQLPSTITAMASGSLSAMASLFSLIQL